MESSTTKLRFVCVSDTHNHAPGDGYKLPKGDVLIHAGDLGNEGTYNELNKAATWLKDADFAVKIVIAGNHELSLDPKHLSNRGNGDSSKEDQIVDRSRQLMESIPGVVYLQHSSADINMPGRSDVAFRVFGSPCSPCSPGRPNSKWAFQYQEDEAHALWNDLSDDIDVLITHTPPSGHSDASQHWQRGGCPALKQALWKIRPPLHICGHCHEGRGAQIVRWSDEPNAVDSVRTWNDSSRGTKKQSLLTLTGAKGGYALEVGKETAVINASVMAKSHGIRPREFNKPIVVDIDLPVKESS